MSAQQTMDRIGVLHLDGWAGRTQQRVRVIGETPKRYRIRAIECTQLAGRYRWINAGDTALVPKHAITFPTDAAHDAQGGAK